MRRHSHIISAGKLLTIILMATGSAILPTSCSDDDLQAPESKGELIKFAIAGTKDWHGGTPDSRSSDTQRTVSELNSNSGRLYLIGGPAMLASRGSSVTTATIENFGVYAAQTTATDTDGLRADYMNNVEVTRDNGWAPAQEYHWPTDGELHLNAYAPYTTSASSEGVTALPGVDETGGLTLGYTVPADVTSQQDLMWATPVNASSSPCELTFNHALTAISFVAGSELAPCTVKSISITGVNSSGTLNIETGEWSGLTGSAEYVVEPDVTLAAASGSSYVAAGSSLLGDREMFMLLPQTLPTEATVSLTVESGGRISVYTADISGGVWPAGATMVYRVSAGSSSPQLILQVTDADGNPLTELSSPYNGSTFSYRVSSYYDSDTQGEATQSIDWETQLLDASGNVLGSNPDWIKTLSESGTGITDCTLETRLSVPVFLAMSEHTRTMRETPDINTTSGMNPYNLAATDGGSGVDNTANCYVINAPGSYSLPLVYGNAIKDGATNESAYVSTLKATTANNRKALMHFINHLGNEITDPYIYANTGCEAGDAVLVWEERLNTVTNVALSADGKNLTFDIPADYIRQGNAVVAVRDKNGEIMWSWHLWLTDYVAGNGLQPVEANGTTGYLYPENLGRVYGGDHTEFKAEQVTVRITQKNVPDGMQPLTAEFTITQASDQIVTLDGYTFYQWGRKDPMVAGVESYYNADGDILSGVQLPTISFGATHKDMIMSSIMEPGKFVSTTETELRGISPYYCNLWDIDNLASSPQGMHPDNVKTIYDPCPAGAKVPVGNEFQALSNLTINDAGTQAIFTDANGDDIIFLLYGYRQLAGRALLSAGTGTYWTALSGGATRTIYYVISQLGTGSIQTYDATYGFGVRPVAE
ncbi:MAG: fimbrillin family protein [Paramuribaculum sp.]|nr:fimbrillin family protein [Paramuribaculum sp.]